MVATHSYYSFKGINVIGTFAWTASQKQRAMKNIYGIGGKFKHSNRIQFGHK
jgi:hypothetical protein